MLCENSTKWKGVTERSLHAWPSQCVEWIKGVKDDLRPHRTGVGKNRFSDAQMEAMQAMTLWDRERGLDT